MVYIWNLLLDCRRCYVCGQKAEHLGTKTRQDLDTTDGWTMMIGCFGAVHCSRIDVLRPNQVQTRITQQRDSLVAFIEA